MDNAKICGKLSEHLDNIVRKDNSINDQKITLNGINFELIAQDILNNIKKGVYKYYYSISNEIIKKELKDVKVDELIPVTQYYYNQYLLCFDILVGGKMVDRACFFV